MCIRIDFGCQITNLPIYLATSVSILKVQLLSMHATASANGVLVVPDDEHELVLIPDRFQCKKMTLVYV